MSKYDLVDKDKHITQLWGDNGRGHYTHQEDMYMRLFKEMLPEFKGGEVLEVGPGDGRFAKMMFDEFKIGEYGILDLEKNFHSSIWLLTIAKTCFFVASQDYESLFDLPFDLFVSNVCLPETPEYYWKSIVKNILPNCKNAFIIGGDASPSNCYNTHIVEEFDRIFDSHQVIKTGYCSTFAIAGQKN